MILYAISHPINIVEHPTIPEGFRWTVSTSSDPTNVAACLGAGWAPDADTAAWIAAQATAIAVGAVRLNGGVSEPAQIVLNYDPVPAGHDTLNIGA